MPARSRSQQHLMAAAEHGADFPMAKKLRKSMTHDQLHDFAVGSEADKPEHIVKGSSHDVVASNAQTLKNKGLPEHEAVKNAIRTASTGKHPHRGKNLGKYLHPKKGASAPDIDTVDPDHDGIPDAEDPRDQ